MLVKTPCLSSQNNCSHLCLRASENTFVCDCPTGMTLSSTSSTSCVVVKKDFEIYFADSHAKTVNHLVKYVNQSGFSIRPLVTPSNERLDYPVALDYDPLEEYIYWTDRKTKKVYYFKFIAIFHIGSFVTYVKTYNQCLARIYCNNNNGFS